MCRFLPGQEILQRHEDGSLLATIAGDQDGLVVVRRRVDHPAGLRRSSLSDVTFREL